MRVLGIDPGLTRCGLGVVEEVQDYHGSPTPIQTYELPGHGTMRADAPMPDQGTKASNGAEQPRVSTQVPPDDPTGAKPQYTLLATVERMIREAKSMEDLLKAAEEAKKLKNENDRKTARHTYNQKRQILMAAEQGQQT